MIVFPERLGPSNVTALTGFIATREQEDHLALLKTVVDSISRSDMDLQLKHLLAERAVVPKVSTHRDTIQPAENRGFGDRIFQSPKPLRKWPTPIDLKFLHHIGLGRDRHASKSAI